MIITFTNVIGAIRTAFSVVRSGLKMWLGFQTSETLGREEVVNGDFASNTWWTVETPDAVISNGKANFNTARTNYGIYRANLLTSGKQYEVVFTIDSYTSGAVHLNIGGVVVNSYSSEDTFTAYITGGGTEDFGIQSDNGGAILSINNVSLKELTQITPDKSGNNNVGELFTGKALEFDGAGDYVDISGFSMSGNNATFAFWAYIRDNARADYFFDFQSSTTRLLFGFGQASQKLAVYSGGWQDFGDPPQDQWVRIVLTVNGTTAKCFVDGVQLGTDVTISTYDFSTPTTAHIGARYTPETFPKYYDGLLSDFQVYNSVWSSDDIAYDYANPNKLAIDNPSTSLNVTNLKAYWALSEGDGLVAYDSGTNLEEEEVQNGTFELGSEEVVDGDFSSSVNWADSGNQWVINNNTATYTGDGTPNELLQEISFIGGRTYQIKIDVASISGTLKARFNNQQENKVEFSQTGIQTLYITASGSGNITNDLSISRETGTVSAVLNSVSVKELPNWSLGDGWSVANGVAIQSGGVGQLSQTGVLAAGKSYSVSVTIDSIASGTSLKVSLGSAGAELLFSNVGATTLIGSTSSSVGNTILYLLGGQSGFSGSISNVSVREVTASDHGGLIVGAEYVDDQPRIPQLGMQNWSKGSNLVTYSEDFSEWTSQEITVIPNATTSPIGSGNATKIIATTVSTTHQINKLSLVASSTCVASIYAKAAGSNTFSVLDGAIAVNGAFFDLDTESVTNKGSGVGTIESVGDGWYRCSTVMVTTGFRIYHPSSASPISGDGTSGIYIWGAQLEQSSSVGAYRLTDGGATLNSTVIPNPTIPTKDIFGNLVRDRLNSFNLDGSGYAEVADADDLDFGTGDFTLECWLRIDGNTDRRLLDKRNTTSGYTLYLTGSNVLKLELNDNITPGNVGFDLTSSLNSNTWLHLAIVCDRSANATCYVNKAAQTPVNISSKGGNIDSTSNLIIGADAPDGTILFSTDIISDVRLYKGKLLSVTEVENNYNAGLSAHTN